MRSVPGTMSVEVVENECKGYFVCYNSQNAVRFS